MLKKAHSALKYMLITIGSIALLMIVLAFTTAPFWIWYNLGVKKAGIHRPPEYIIVMGGGGMPSHSALMRCWYAAQVAKRFPASRVIVALPGDARDSLSSVNQMKKELSLRGVAPGRIYLEDSGTNTRAEAVNMVKLISNIEFRISNNELKQKPKFDIQYSTFNIRHSIFHSSLLIVTSPEHLCRSVLAFQKAGFLKVDGLPAFEQPIESDIMFNARLLGGRNFIPDIGKSLSLRYQFWMQMEYEFLVLREYLALAYYKLQGWI
jgi:uncharacterized SAM-binding protein YcdF (DUF218 family)